jgi:pimeloyl-ACP methyl ester carboxylesterase
MISPVIAESATIERPRRAGLVWSEHGAVDGKPVVFFHGWPSSRVLGSAWQSAAARRGWRVITPDRPGLGKSPRQPGRRFSDWPATLEALMDELGIERCPVVGMSGGGPYALVSAARLPGRVAAAVVISGAPPLDDVNDHRLIRPWFRTLAWTKRHLPGPTRLGFRLAGHVVQRMSMTTARRFARTTLPAADAAFFRTTAGDATLASGLEAWSSGGEGVHDEGSLYLEPWDFAPEEIATPVGFWHGEIDSIFHWSLTERLARRVPGAALHLVPGGGHFTPLYEAQDAIFDWIERATASS